MITVRSKVVHWLYVHNFPYQIGSMSHFESFGTVLNRFSTIKFKLIDNYILRDVGYLHMTWRFQSVTYDTARR
jgi:hypothetical protein